ncbi:hypothetical protein SGPA1_10089 [Streptomyces misionensis JCM 4497]
MPVRPAPTRSSGPPRWTYCWTPSAAWSGGWRGRSTSPTAGSPPPTSSCGCRWYGSTRCTAATSTPTPCSASPSTGPCGPTPAGSPPTPLSAATSTSTASPAATKAAAGAWRPPEPPSRSWTGRPTPPAPRALLAGERGLTRSNRRTGVDIRGAGCLTCGSSTVMSVSAKPWLADRQPSRRGGVPQVTTGPDDDFGKREAPRGRDSDG